MKVCVTGGAGYIGSHTCKSLANAGHEVLVYDNFSTGHKDFVKWGGYVEGDIRDTAKLRDCFRSFAPDAVIHFAASSQVGESVINPGKYYHNNVVGTLSLLEAMRDGHVGRIVVSGSAAVYGIPSQTPIVEGLPLNPVNPYGATKMHMERMLADFATAHGLSWTSLRYFNAAGSSPDSEIGELHVPETHLMPKVIFAGMGITGGIDIYGDDYDTPDGTCIRDYIHVDDLAAAHVNAVKYLHDGGENMPINLGTGTGFSVREIINGVEQIAGHPIKTSVKARRAGDPPVLVAEASRARELLGWQPQYNLQDMLRHAWNFFEANGQKVRKCQEK